MSKDDWIYIAHMRDMTRKASGFISGLEKTDYDQNEPLRIALTHIVQMLGEAAGRVSIEFRLRHSEIPWHEIIGMRHRIVHDYMGVDEDIVWEVVKADFPLLVKHLEELEDEISQ